MTMKSQRLIGMEQLNSDKVKALFLDKDGVLVDNSGYPYRIPKDKIYKKHTVEGLLAFQQAGWKLFIVSNQSWIAKNRMTTEETEKVFQSVMAQFAEHGIQFEGFCFCPHKPSDACECRKPKPGLLETVSQEFDIDKEFSIMVGDQDTDIEAGKNFGVKTCLVMTGAGLKNVDKCQPDYVAKDVNSLAEKVLKG